MNCIVTESTKEKVTRTKVHICQSVSGAIRNWNKKMWDEVGASNGMTGAAVKEKFRIWDFEGKRVIPIGEPCEGFSYQDGCPGHEITEQETSKGEAE